MHRDCGRWRPSRTRNKKMKHMTASRTVERAERHEEEEEKESEAGGSETETVHPTQQTSTGQGKSSEKFGRFDLNIVIENSEYLILHSDCLQQMTKGLLCPKCNSDSVTVDISDRKGFAFKIKVSCNACLHVLSNITSSPRVVSESTRPPFDINRKMVESFVKIGTGYRAMQKFGTVIGMKIIDQSTYRTHLVKLCENIELKEKILSLARAAVRAAIIEADPSLQSEEVIDVMVSFDGSWHKRGHTSLYGFVSVIDVITGLVLDYEVLSKYCHMCSVVATEMGDESEEFKIWYENHIDTGECNINFEGFAGNMEGEGAVLLWKRSEQEAKMRYTKFVSDGDAKSLSAINKAQPYGEAIVVEKEECINHVGKRMGTALRNVISDNTKRGITLGGKAEGALTQAKIDKLQSLYQKAMISNAPDVQKMKAAILATPHHYASTDKKPQHKYCPQGTDSWCFYQKAKALNRRSRPSHSQLKTTLNQKVFEAILPTYKRLSEDDLVERCKRLLTQNANEALHNVIWSKVPKVTFVGRGRLELGVTQAIGEFNMGVTNMLAVSERPSSAQSMRNAVNLDLKRMAQSDKEAEIEAKKRRATRKKDKKKKKTKGKDSYVAGGGD